MCEREREGLITKLTKHSLGWMDRKAEVKTVGGRKGRRRDRDTHQTITWEKEERGWGKKPRVKLLIGGNEGRVQGRRSMPRD